MEKRRASVYAELVVHFGGEIVLVKNCLETHILIDDLSRLQKYDWEDSELTTSKSTLRQTLSNFRNIDKKAYGIILESVGIDMNDSKSDIPIKKLAQSRLLSTMWTVTVTTKWIEDCIQNAGYISEHEYIVDITARHPPLANEYETTNAALSGSDSSAAVTHLWIAKVHPHFHKHDTDVGAFISGI